jgi:hypothetical protein
VKGSADSNEGARIGPRAKRQAVLRVARGESLEAVAKSLGLPAETVAEWVRKFEAARANLTPEPGEERTKAFERSTSFDLDFKSWAEIMHPELLAEMDPKTLDKLKPEEIRELFIKQAIAQEKVGYEKHSPKYFLPEEEDPFPKGRKVRPADTYTVREINRPLLVLGGVLLGVALAILGAKNGMFLESTEWWLLGVIAAAAVGALIFGGR